MKLGLNQGIQFHYLAPFSEKARKNKVYVCISGLKALNRV